MALYFQYRGQRPVVAVMFTHTHTDHRGGAFRRDRSCLLVAVQIFDGITAAVFAVMISLIVADGAFLGWRRWRRPGLPCSGW